MYLKGKFNEAVVFTDDVEETAISQIVELCNQEFVQDSKIRIMPDTHAGAGCTIGTTMTLTDKVVPNLVGVDISCGMYTMKVDFDPTEGNLRKLDDHIRKNIPAGFSIYDSAVRMLDITGVHRLACYAHLDGVDRIHRSIGTLGGGNHFIELARADDGSIFLTVHTGSRNLGKQVCEYYQEKAWRNSNRQLQGTDELIRSLKAAGREKDIQSELSKLPKYPVVRNKMLAYLEGRDFDDYIHDMKIVQEYAFINRITIIERICVPLGIDMLGGFNTTHNYVDTDSMILRKGAISAKLGERVIIPLNMRDGSLICTGKGNADWNYSAPHGAGRIMSRTEAKAVVRMEDYLKSMAGIFTTSVNESTLDESPFAYKDYRKILECIKDTVDVEAHIKPLYNFKA